MTTSDINCFALLDDCNATAAQPTSRLYLDFVCECRCDDPVGLDEVWASVDRHVRAGLHALVLADYEWGRGLQRPAPAAQGAGGALRILLFATLHHLSAAEVEDWLQAREREQGSELAPAGVQDLGAAVDRAGFGAAIERIHAAIAAGETYQLNYTYRLDFRVFGSPLGLYRRLRARQPVAFGALIALPAQAGSDAPTHVLSCSPELFLRKRGGRLQAKPMKGTAARAAAPDADRAACLQLAGDIKNRAENLMIVDLLRNDLGRVAATGSVRVPALFEVEAHPTLFQMTSTIEAMLPPATSFPDLLRALFPCGSITGAPKRRTMELIAGLESTPRGLYTGAIGWVDAPDADAACGDFCLSVAIRTLVLGAPRLESAAGLLRPGTIGVGAGIVIDSRADEEYEECRLKARFLTGLDPGFALIETLLATRDEGIPHLERHLARLAASAGCLGFALPLAQIRQALDAQRQALPPATPFRLRLNLAHDGHFDIVAAALDALAPGPVKLLRAESAVDGNDPLLRHKTTWRVDYDAAVAEAVHQGAFDMLFCNRDGFLTEGGRSNLFVRLDGEWLTPPLAAGVLPGVMRSVLLQDPAWHAREAWLRPDDLVRAERIVVCNALRGVLEAVLVR